MKKLIVIIFLSGFLLLDANAQNRSDTATPAVPADFVSDGCTFFPDGAYLDCCVAHDRAYYAGGSWSARWRADKKLFQCVAGKKSWWNKPIAPVMWAGVRVFGVSFLPTSFRWGFGREKSPKAGSPRNCPKKSQKCKTVSATVNRGENA